MYGVVIPPLFSYFLAPTTQKASKKRVPTKWYSIDGSSHTHRKKYNKTSYEYDDESPKTGKRQKIKRKNRGRESCFLIFLFIGAGFGLVPHRINEIRFGEKMRIKENW